MSHQAPGRTLGGRPPALLLVATLACCSPEPDERSAPHLPNAAPNTVHLLHEATLDRVQSSWTGLLPVEPIELDLGTPTQHGEFRVFELPWRQGPGAVSVTRDGQRLIQRVGLDPLRERGGFHLLRESRGVEAEDDAPDSAQTRISTCAGLRDGASLEFQFAEFDSEATLRLRLRPAKELGRLRVEVNGREVAVFASLDVDWQIVEVPLAGLEGTEHRVRLTAVDSPNADPFAVYLDRLDWQSHSASRVVTLAEHGGAHRATYSLAPPAPSTPLRVNGGRTHAYLVHSHARLFAEGVESEDDWQEHGWNVVMGGPQNASTGQTLEPSIAYRDLEPTRLGLHSFQLPGEVQALSLLQPAASLYKTGRESTQPLAGAADASPESRGLDSARAADSAVREASDSVRRCLLRSDRREALFLPTPASAELSFVAPARFELRYATSTLGRATEPPDDARCELAVRVGNGDWRVIAEHAVQYGWQTHRLSVDLGEAGRPGSLDPGDDDLPWTLRITTEATTDANDVVPVAFADPRLLPATPEDSAPAPNLLVYLVDTLRADRLGCYGGPNPCSPRLDALAEQGYCFERLQAVASHTRPSTASILTGLYPRYHAATTKDAALPEELDTLAEHFARAGRSTGAFVANNQVAGSRLRFEQGFHRFVGPESMSSGARAAPDSSVLTDWALDWVDEHAGESFFLYLHSLDPHTPYEPPEELRMRFDPDYTGVLRNLQLSNVALNRVRRSQGLTARDFEFLKAVYDALILHQDAQIGRLLDGLQARGVLDDTIVVVLSDHGEEFGEHEGMYHGGRLWSELIHVPLIVWIPERLRRSLPPPPVRIPRRVSHVDVLPSLLDLLGLPPGDGAQGESFVAELRGSKARPTPILSEDAADVGCIVEDGFKLIWNGRDEELRYGLFDLGADPEEQHDLSRERTTAVEDLLESMRLLHADYESAGFTPRVAERIEMSLETRLQLERLGYLDPEGDESHDGDEPR